MKDLFEIRDNHPQFKKWFKQQGLVRERHTHIALLIYKDQWTRRSHFTFEDYLNYLDKLGIRKSPDYIDELQVKILEDFVLRFGLDRVLTATTLLIEEDADLIDNLKNLGRFMEQSSFELEKLGYKTPIYREGKLV